MNYLKQWIFQPVGKQYRCTMLAEMCGDTDLSGAGCGNSASPVLRRVWPEQSGHSTHPYPGLYRYSESAMRSGISISNQRYQKQIISASEIINLNDLEAFVRLPGKFPVAKIKLEYKKREKIAETIVARKSGDKNGEEKNRK